MSGWVVVDASLALKWVLEEPYSSQAEALLEAWSAAGVYPVAPTLLSYEAANVLHRRAARGGITAEDATRALNDLLHMGVRLEHDPSTVVRAFHLARQLGLPAAYDAQYLAVAEREGCECWTADERLWNAVKERLPWVRWIGSRAANTQ